jgi:hypothetical protein
MGARNDRNPMTINTTNNGRVQPVAETETLPSRLHLDGGCLEGVVTRACLSKVTKEHLLKVIDDFVRMSVQDDNHEASPMRI